MCYMMMGDVNRIRNRQLKEMGSILTLKSVLEATDDEEIQTVGRKVGLWSCASAVLSTGLAMGSQQPDHSPPPFIAA